jgi:hypothetical protein
MAGARKGNAKIKMKNVKLWRPFGQIFMVYRDNEDHIPRSVMWHFCRSWIMPKIAEKAGLMRGTFEVCKKSRLYDIF